MQVNSNMCSLWGFVLLLVIVNGLGCSVFRVYNRETPIVAYLSFVP